ncbi:hypothetical protein Tco_0035576, partial [Tanacetum coccineum]
MTSNVHKKTFPRSCLRWKPTGKIFKTVGPRWVPTEKIFTSSTTKVDSEPTNGSNEDITNQYECEQTLDVSAGTLYLSAADITTSSQQELDLLFGPLYDEFFNAEPTSPTTTVHAEENNDNQATDTQFQQVEFINPFCTPIQEVAESCSRNIDNSNMHTFYQPHDFEYRWTKDHPLEQVYGNPSKLVKTRRQLETDPEMYMFALTVSTAEPKNIKEAMADSAWIKVMQEELHQFDRLQVWELVDKPFGKTVIKL